LLKAISRYDLRDITVENKPASAIARAASPFERSGMRAKIPSSFSLLVRIHAGAIRLSIV
jgi:hypothetical protein